MALWPRFNGHKETLDGKQCRNKVDTRPTADQVSALDAIR